MMSSEGLRFLSNFRRSTLTNPCHLSLSHSHVTQCRFSRCMPPCIAAPGGTDYFPMASLSGNQSLSQHSLWRRNVLMVWRFGRSGCSSGDGCALATFDVLARKATSPRRDNRSVHEGFRHHFEQFSLYLDPFYRLLLK